MWAFLFSYGGIPILIIFLIIYFAMWYYPMYVWERKRLGKKGRARIIAHRGSTSEGLPENSLAAFRDAVAAGADIVEFDVYLTRDGQVVVHHDDSFTRMCGETPDGKIWEFNYHQFPKIVPPEQQMGRTHLHEEQHWSQIPLLSEVLDVIPHNVNMIIEFKQDSIELIEKVRTMLYEKQRTDHIFWFSLIETINDKLRKSDPNIHTMCSIMEMLKILACYYIGILPFIKVKDAVFGITIEEITMTRINNEKALKHAPGWFKNFLGKVMSGKPPWAMCAPKLFAHLRSRGIPIWFLGVNSEEDVLLAVQAGATGILTDRVNWLAAHLRESGHVFETIEGHHEDKKEEQRQRNGDSPHEEATGGGEEGGRDGEDHPLLGESHGGNIMDSHVQDFSAMEAGKKYLSKRY